jgi:DNA replication protein DnaC
MSRLVSDLRQGSFVLGFPPEQSHLAQALGHCAVQKGVNVLFFTQAKLLANLYAARATNSYEKRFQALAKVPLLIIDDFGLNQ